MRTSTRAARHLPTLLIAAALGTGSILAATSPAHAASTGTVVPNSTQKMSAPTLESVKFGTYSKGTKLNLTCYTDGQLHKGSLGSGTIWYQTSDGYWVADKDIDTGSNDPVAPACGRIDTNAWYTVASASSGQMVDLPGANTADRTPLQQWPANGHDAQKWRFVSTGDGYYRVESKVKKGVSWDAEYGHTKNGTKMVAYGYQGAPNMQWRPVWKADGKVTFRPRHANDQCLDLPAGSKDKGAKLQTWSCNGNNAQNWRLKAVGHTVSPKAQKAVNWALNQIGSGEYDFRCELFVEKAYGTNSQYRSALTAYQDLKNKGQINTDWRNAPAGALVFSRSSADLGNGHVVIAVGDGTFVSGGLSPQYFRSTVEKLNTPNPSPGAEMLGWAHAPSSWPGV